LVSRTEEAVRDSYTNEKKVKEFPISCKKILANEFRSLRRKGTKKKEVVFLWTEKGGV